MRFDRRAIPPPRILCVAPEHTHLLVRDTPFLERDHDVLRRLFVAEAFQRDRHVRFRLAAIQLEPIRASLPKEVFHRFLLWSGDWLVVQEKAPAVQVECDRRGEVIVFQLAAFHDPSILLVNPGIESCERFHRSGHIDVGAEVPQTSEASGDVKRDIVVRPTAGEPGPRSVSLLKFAQFAQRASCLILQTIGIEQDTHVTTCGTLLLRLTDPGRFFQDHGLQVRILLHGTIQCRRPFPLVEDAADLWVGVGNVLSQCVRIESIKGLFAAFVRIFHQIGQGHNRIPGGIRDHLHGQ